ncbi:alpha-(1,6)-fucosyltransferase-like [Penaeus chinensis]|uniref:alpha-(1,6)-fucosyltransferase-like n=1 Tax=Penaeus chinensis TaxID=139456 RepID=UPI001FB6EC8E|nr:alpha-(1,6)-fucosyltransferase-like [Penaeus chinensis]
MEAVNDFFDDLEIRGTNVTSRRIFLATDDPRVVQEARKKYPNYRIVCNEESVATAHMKERRSEANMKNFFSDVYFLSRSDFLVCSMSSNICRLAYELMQTVRPDAPSRAFSVDSAYWFHFETDNKVQARYPHTPRRKQPNLQDGFRAGRNLRTASYGLYPVYKTVEILRLADVPSFDHIDEMEK